MLCGINYRDASPGALLQQANDGHHFNDFRPCTYDAAKMYFISQSKSIKYPGLKVSIIHLKRNAGIEDFVLMSM